VCQTQYRHHHHQIIILASYNKKWRKLPRPSTGCLLFLHEATCRRNCANK